jgi:hypothetical protein
MLESRGWRVYCADGTTYTSDPSAIPPSVQGIVLFHSAPYRTLVYGNDEYELEGVTLYGSLMPDDEFEAIRLAMVADMEWPE